ncbi:MULTISPECIES: ABC transporter ATP-binding protein [unclassified Dietzia]|uniref:ABC transporter ATP-binding protein n=1 Tax=unclassified Dietzia TaxID=2617939 RepID=UPI000D2157B0|nr:MULTISPECIES: ABC transporter ATP-binding protein [unclassified Dietzia]AVZ40157.1 ABC transporter [Dietzia sp. JS16-p6b]QGW25599.1 ABC transporter ATPase subunit [Dietzia sp. DQ12-45-1b]
MTPPPEIAIRARGLRKTYTRGRVQVRALDGVDVTVEKGRWTAIMGPSGSGKSTLMHCLAGLDSPDQGTVSIGSTDITRLGDAGRTRLRRARVGFVFQSFNLVPSLSVRENIVLPVRMTLRRPDRDRLDSLAGELGIGDLLRRRPHELSGGQQQRVAIARALLPRPDVVFADEPTGNLDSESGEAVLGLLGACARESGQTVVMVTHDTHAAAHTDTALILADGRIADEVGSPTQDTVDAAMRTLAGRRAATA